jgi:ferrochelatase
MADGIANSPAGPYDGLIVVSFGGPEGRDEVMPFLENVLRGRNVPRERMLEVAEHYYHFGGKSPINDQNRALIAALKTELASQGPNLPVYWGNRNWHPLLADTIRQMAADGVRRALAFVTSAFGSYSGCRQYLDNIANARQEAGPGAPDIDKLRVFYNHPGFVETMIENTRAALEKVPIASRDAAAIVYTAHSIPLSMAQTSPYVGQLEQASRLVNAAVRRGSPTLVYQSRSGPPSQPWLEPDICDYLRGLAAAGGPRDVVVVPIGFISGHLEVLYDLDTEAGKLCDDLGLRMHRAATVGVHPRFIRMIRELIVERFEGSPVRRALGDAGPWPDVCPADCCPSPRPRGESQPRP